MRRIIYWLAILTLVVIAFAMRYALFSHGDFYYLIDQSRDMLLAKSIAIDHTFTLIGGRTGVGGIFHGPLWWYMLVPFFLLAHGDPYFTLIPMYLSLSMATVIVGFFVARSLYGNIAGILTLILFTFSSSFISQVTFTSNSHVLPLLVLLYIYFFVRFMRGTQWTIAPTITLIGLSFQFESAFAVMLIPITLLGLFIAKKLPSLVPTFVGVGGMILSVSTFILFELRHHFLMTSVFLQNFGNHMTPIKGYERYSDIHFRLLDRIHLWWENIFVPVYSNADMIDRIVICVVIALGLGIFVRNIARNQYTQIYREYLWFILIPILTFGLYILYPLPLWDHYFFGVWVVSIFTLMLSLLFLCEISIGEILIVLFFALTLGASAEQIISDTKSANVIVSDGSYKVQANVSRWVYYDNKYNNKVGEAGYFVYYSGDLTYNMDYLMWWEGYRQGIKPIDNHKHPITYLIYYPAPAGDLKAHEIWRKAIVKTNAPVILHSDFIGGLSVDKLRMNVSEEEPDPNYYQNLIFR